MKPVPADVPDRSITRNLRGTGDDHLRELNYADRRALHNFRNFTWVEQHGRSSQELREPWDEDFWLEVCSQDVADEWDHLINAFNRATGLTNEP